MTKYRPGPEKKLQNEVLEYLDQVGIFAWPAKAIPLMKRKNSIKRGVSDILGIMPKSGRMLVIELKSKTGVVSQVQEEFLAVIKMNGGISGVARSLEDVIQIIKCEGG